MTDPMKRAQWKTGSLFMASLIGGLAMLVANLGSGALWDLYGPASTSASGAVVTGAVLLGLVVIEARSRRARRSG
jgi:hypothetical protein